MVVAPAEVPVDAGVDVQGAVGAVVGGERAPGAVAERAEVAAHAGGVGYALENYKKEIIKTLLGGEMFDSYVGSASRPVKKLSGRRNLAKEKK